MRCKFAESTCEMTLMRPLPARLRLRTALAPCSAECSVKKQAGGECDIADAASEHA